MCEIDEGYYGLIDIDQFGLTCCRAILYLKQILYTSTNTFKNCIELARDEGLEPTPRATLSTEPRTPGRVLKGRKSTEPRTPMKVLKGKSKER